MPRSTETLQTLLQGSGFGVRVLGLGLGVSGLGFWVLGLGFRGSGLRVKELRKSLHHLGPPQSWVTRYIACDPQ